jgi:probable F420-dependent oxidoreductase
MRVGLALPHYDFSYPDRDAADIGATVEWARRAESLGFDSAWISDHFFLDISRYGGPAGRVGALEPIVTLSAIAAATSRIRLGTLVLCEAFRPPATLAKQAATLQELCGGRLELGLGAGWYEDEYVANGFDFPPPGERMTRLEESLQIVGGMLSGEATTFDGKHYRVRDAVIVPPPRHPTRLWVGSKGGPRSLGIVARHAGGWNTAWKIGTQAYAEKAALLDRLCEKAGRDPADVRRSIGLYTIAGRDPKKSWEMLRAAAPPGSATMSFEEFSDGALVGTPEQCAERLADLAAAGADELIMSPAPLPLSIPVPEIVEEIAELLIPLVRNV